MKQPLNPSLLATIFFFKRALRKLNFPEQLQILMLLSANINQQPWNSPLQTLSLLQKSKTLNDTNQIHARLITTGLIKNHSFTTKLVLSLYSSPYSPLVEFARHVFFTWHAFNDDEVDDGDPFLWNAIIKSYSHGQDPKDAIFKLCLMMESGVCVDKYSLSLVLKACSRVGLMEEGMQIHGLLTKLGLGFDLFLQNCLIAFYVKCWSLEFARQLFDRMQRRDSVSYNSMIDGYVKCGKVELAYVLFKLMPLEERNLISWNCLISGFAQSEDGLDIAWELFDKMPERDLFSWNSMIDGCMKCGKFGDAQALFDRMPKRDMVSWANMINGYAKLGRVDIARNLFGKMAERDTVVCNAMMGGYVQNGCFLEALDIFYGMQGDSYLSPDNATVSIAVSAIAQLGHIDKGVLMHRYITENRFSLNEKLGVALIDMYSKCGSVEDAMLVFEDIQEKSVDHWNAMIGGLAINGLGELAFDMLIEMQRMCIKPDNITFIGLLNACGHAGMVKEGMMCFELMRRVHNLEPKLQHYGCMVDILSRAGYLEEAKRFVEHMPIEPNEVILRTLLSACKAHETLNIGGPVAEHLIGLDSFHSSSYVLLSNMFAGLGMWNDVRRVRTMMKTRSLQKTPGRSWIELEGNVHEFFVQDKSHPQAGEICSLLDGLSTPMKIAV